MSKAIAISSGHAQDVPGASGECDEVTEARKIVDRVHELLQQANVPCVKFHDNESQSQSENLDAIVSWHNQQDRQRDISVHLNAGGNDGPMGCEVLWVTQEELAGEISAAIAAAGHLKNRGPKERTDLAFLNGTDMPSCLLEVIFCDSSADTELLNEHHEAICVAIAESIADVRLEQQPPAERPPIDMPDRPPPEPAEEQSRVNIVGRAQGDVQVTINGVVVYGHGRRGRGQRCPNRVDMVATMQGDVIVVLNGEEFHNKPVAIPPEPPPDELQPEIKANHKNVFATTFGGEADNEHSAYPPYDSDGMGEYLDDESFYVSLPVAVDDAEDRERGVTVFNRANGKSAPAPVKDKGPWVINDDAYVFGDERPIAEQCYNDHEPLPQGSGNNAGKIPANPAGIDLSPGLMKELGMTDNGPVDWRWNEAEIA
jgi:N-acetylmuramoyl-L-alanine amidase